jgi:geranylgeranyl pyrophosphate synthase
MLLEIEKKLANFVQEFNPFLLSFLEDNTKIVQAMRYSVENGGKRLRPFLLCETTKLLGVDSKISYFAACSIEYIHTYSLIHDDLPAMDNDDLRRGKPTLHKHYDEATAILAGDALNTHAFKILTHKEFNIASDIKIELINLISEAAGFKGMIGGQMLDIDLSLSKNVDYINMQQMQSLKTGALIEASCLAGAILGNANLKQKQALKKYAFNIGLAFQIQDDILDFTSDINILGKATQKDFDKNKATFIKALTLEKAIQKAKDLVEEAKSALSIFEHNNTLKELADFIIRRKY